MADKVQGTIDKLMQEESDTLLRALSSEQLKEILERHRKWFETGKKEGERADLSRVNLSEANLANAALFEADLKGSDLSNATLTETTFIGADLYQIDLSEANLYKANLSRAELTKAKVARADLANASLRGALCFSTDFTGARLLEADIQEAVLVGADFKGATLAQAKFEKANLLNTILRDADLQDADLAGATGLLARQLAGANVSGAKLPEDIHEFAGLKQVEELSKSAKKLFISLLLGCVYSWLTLSTTTDANLLTNSSSTPLPIIQAQVPIAVFHGVAPLILLSLFVYFHLYLQRLWRELANLPAIFPDGKPLDEKAYPWLLNGLVRAHFTLLKKTRPPLSRLETSLSIILAWWVVPFTTGLFWLRSLQRHDWLLTGFQVIWAVTAILCAAWFYQLAKTTLSGQRHTPIRFKENWMHVEPYKETVKQFGPRTTLAIFITFLLLVVSDGAINLYKEVDSGNPKIDEVVNLYRGHVLNVLPFVGARATADFKEQDVSTKPANWFFRKDEELASVVHGAQLKDADLRWAKAERAFLMNADLRGAKLQSADLSGAKLQGANLSGATLQGAILVEANLQSANLVVAKLEGARLFAAKLQNANLVGAELQGADLHEADLQNANLLGAKLQDADLSGADLTGAKNLTQAQIDQACVYEGTKLPPGFKRPKPCPIEIP